MHKQLHSHLEKLKALHDRLIEERLRDVTTVHNERAMRESDLSMMDGRLLDHRLLRPDD